MGYWTAPEARRQGITTSAMHRLCLWLFDEVGMARLELDAAATNHGSNAVAERLGFRLDGTRRSAMLLSAVGDRGRHCSGRQGIRSSSVHGSRGRGPMVEPAGRARRWPRGSRDGPSFGSGGRSLVASSTGSIVGPLARQGRRGVDALVADLGDPNPKVRCRAANSLWGLWERFDEEERERAYPALHLAARDDPDGPTRGNAVGAIVANEAPGAIDLGIASLADADWVVRAIAASALGDPRDERIVDALLPLLEDPEGWVRTAAAYSLGWQGDPRALDPLRGLAHERRDVEVRKAARWAIRHIGA